MPYGTVVAYRTEDELTIRIKLPAHGEISRRGQAENLVDLTESNDLETEDGDLAIKLTVCRPFYRRRQYGNRSGRRIA